VCSSDLDVTSDCHDKTAQGRSKAILELTRVLPRLGEIFNQRAPQELLGQLVEAVLQLGTEATQRRAVSSLDCCPATVLVPPHQALQQVHLKVEITGRCT